MNVIRSIAAVVLVINIVISTLTIPYLYFNFRLNRQYIAKVFCVNRDKPITVCGGQCYLNNQVKKVNEQRGKGEFTLDNRLMVVFFNSILVPVDFSRSAKLLSGFPVPQDFNDLPSSFLSDIFHPPQQVIIRFPIA